VTLDLVPFRGHTVPVLNGKSEITRYNVADYITWLNNSWISGGQPPVMTTYGNRAAEPISTSFEGFVQGMLYADGPVAAAEAYRLRVFGQAPLLYQEMNEGRPGDMFDDPRLDRIRYGDAPGSHQSDLMKRLLIHGDFAGNAFIVDLEDELVLLRPDWVEIVLAKRVHRGAQVGWKQVGIMYYEGGIHVGEGVPFLPGEYAHFVPGLPDPLATYRGMSWLTPLVREVQADKGAAAHKEAFFSNHATVNLAISLPKEITAEQFRNFVDKMEEQHAGAANAYKTLYTGGGADVTVVGANMQQMDFAAVQGKGEPLALDTPIPTPTGWTTMGEVRQGDRVIGRNGHPANVVDVGPVHEGRPCFRVTLKDRTSIIADASHLWVATDRGTAARAEKIYTTQQMHDIFNAPYPNGVGGHRFSLPRTPVVELPEVDLLIDPYVLGAWLGDGATAGAAICGATEDLKFIAAEFESRGYVTTHWETGDKVDVIGVPGGLLFALRAEGVLGDKHIPAQYMRASAAQRMELIRGLMDTDGSVDVLGRCEFSSKWRALAAQVAELVRMHGYRVTMSRKADLRSRTGEQWRVSFRVELDRVPFLLPRKVDRCEAAGDATVWSRSVVTIEPVESVPVRCITVDTDDHLFLAGEGMVPTHNTRIANAAGVPPVLLSFSEGMQGSSLNAGNYTAAKRNFVDTTCRDLWANFACSVQQMDAFAPPKENTRLWYDPRDIPFLNEDSKDRADIFHTQVTTLEAGLRGGWKADAMVKATKAQDLDLLVGEHSGLMSVQMQPPGQDPAAMAEEEAVDQEEYDVLLDEFRAELFDEDEIQRDRFAWLKDEIQRRRYYGALPGERVESGKVGGGQFKELHKRALDAIRRWIADGAPSDADPLEGWKQPQLKTAATQLGIEVPPRSSAPKLKSAILAHARGDRTPNAKAPAKKATARVPAKPDTPDDMLPGEGPVDYQRRKKVDALSAEVAAVTSKDAALEYLKGRKTSELRLLAREFGVDTRVPVPGDHKSRTMTPSTTRAATHDEIAELVLSAFVFDGYRKRWEENAAKRDAADSVQSARDRQSAIDDARVDGRALRRQFDELAAKVPGKTVPAQEALGRARLRFGAGDPPGEIAEDLRQAADALEDRQTFGLISPLHFTPAQIEAQRRSDVTGLRRLAKALDKLKPAGPAPGPDSVAAARERQAQIDTARTYGDLAAELDELANNEVSAKTLASRIDAFGARHPELTEELAPIRAADPADARRLARELAESHGVKITSRAGDVVPLDRKLHDPLDNTLDGGNVEIIRPGYEITLPSGEVVKVRAKVDRAEGPAAPSAPEPEAAAPDLSSLDTDGLDDLSPVGLAELADEHGISVPRPLRDEDMPAAVAKLRQAGVRAPEAGPSRFDQIASTGPRELTDDDRRMLQQAAGPGGSQKLAEQTGRMRQHNQRIEDLVREGYLRKEPGQNRYRITDAGRAVVGVPAPAEPDLSGLDTEDLRDSLGKIDIPGDKYGNAVRQELDGVTAENAGERAASLRRTAKNFRDHAYMTLANPGTTAQSERADAQLAAADAADRAAEALERVVGAPEPDASFRQDYDALIDDAGLRGKSAAQLRRIADELNVTFPKGVTSVTARRKYLLDSVIEHERRTSTGGVGLRRIRDAVARLDAAEDATPPWVAGELDRIRALDADAARDALDMHNAADLKAMLKSRGLKVSGRKRELVDRLVESIRGGEAPDAELSTRTALRERLGARSQAELMPLASLAGLELKRPLTRRTGAVVSAKDFNPNPDRPDAPFGERLKTRDELAREIAEAVAADPSLEARLLARLDDLPPPAPRRAAAKPGAVRQGKFDNPAVPARVGTADSPIRWAEGTDPGWDEARSKRAQRALRAYGTASFEINESLRGEPVETPVFPPEQTAAHIEAIDDLMAVSRTTAPMEQWRGLRAARGMFGDRLDGDMTGVEWREDAYTSTSSNMGVSQYFATHGQGGMLMRIFVSEGIGAAQVKDSRGEAEALLERGLRFRIVADHGWQGAWGYRLVDVEVVPE
jgi:hypothetical protein